MKKAFLETSVFNKAIDENVPPQELLSLINKREATPVIGSHVLYEMEKGFLYDKHKERAINLLDYCLELQPGLITTTSDLLDQEITRARYGSAVLPLMPPKASKRTWEGIKSLRKNPYGHSAIAFVKDREMRREEDEVLKGAAYIKHIKDVKSRIPHKTVPLESYLKLSDLEAPEVIAQALKGQRWLNSYAINRIVPELNALPAIRTLIRANMYVSWIYIENEHRPSKDKLDDGRHLIDASYSDLFITADKGQIKLASILNPDLLVVSWHDLKN